MMILPPKEIMPFVSVDENGNWIHSSDMPENLNAAFEKFVDSIKKSKEYKNKMDVFD